MTRARDLANIADGTFTATDLNLSGTLDVSGDVNFDSGTLFVDASANAVGIGGSTITDSNLLNLQGSSASVNVGVVFNDTNTSKIFGIQNGGSALKFFDYTASAERMRIDASGNVGLGVTPSAWVQHGVLEGEYGGSLSFYNQTNIASTSIGSNASYLSGPAWKYKISSGAALYSVSGNDSSHKWYTAASGTAGNAISFTQAMTLDASGNLLVGTTDNNVTNNSTEAGAGINVGTVGIKGFLSAARWQGSPAVFNRMGNDGEVVYFFKDGNNVGSIGTVDGNSIYIGNGEVNLRMIGVTNDIRPATSAGANRDSAIDLGDANARFKDLYLSGGVYLGGTGAANLLDDYETGTWNATLNGSTTNPTYTSSNIQGFYVKVGDMCTAYLYMVVNITNAGAGTASITGLPFTQYNTAYNYGTGAVTHNTATSPIENGYTSPATDRFVFVAEDSTSSGTWTVGTGYLMMSVTYRTN